MHMYSATPMAAHLLMLPTGARSMHFDSLSPTGPTSPSQADRPPSVARLRSASLDAGATVPHRTTRTHPLPDADATRAAGPPPFNAPASRPSTQLGPRPGTRPAMPAGDVASSAWARAPRPPTAGRPSMTWRY